MAMQLSILITLFLFVSSFSEINAQQIQKTPYTIEEVENELNELESEKDRVVKRYNQVKNHPDAPPQFIANIEAKIQELDDEINRYTKIKKSILQAEGKTKGESNTSTEIQQISKKDFDGLPKSKQEIILANPDKFKIVN